VNVRLHRHVNVPVHIVLFLLYYTTDGKAVLQQGFISLNCLKEMYTEKQICDCTAVFLYKKKVKYVIIYNCLLFLSTLRVL